jgi:hypothetical protein
VAGTAVDRLGALPRAGHGTPMKTAVIGVGNEYGRDDGVGPAVVARLAQLGLPRVVLTVSDGEPTQLIGEPPHDNRRREAFGDRAEAHPMRDTAAAVRPAARPRAPSPVIQASDAYDSRRARRASRCHCGSAWRAGQRCSSACWTGAPVGVASAVTLLVCWLGHACAPPSWLACPAGSSWKCSARRRSGRRGTRRAGRGLARRRRRRGPPRRRPHAQTGPAYRR